MGLPIISADQRLAEKRCAKIALVGVPGSGKTSQIRTLNPATTLLVDTEAGDLSILDWNGDTLRPRTWPEFKDLVVFLAGPMPSASPDQAFSESHFQHVCQKYGDPKQLAKYDTYFVDSLTVLSRMCLAWCKTQPAAFSDKTGKADTRGAYGLLGSEMISALTHLQYVRDKHVIYVCILEETFDDFNRRIYRLQLEGAKTAHELPGILDEVITLAILKNDEGTPYRAFVTGADNTWDFPSKDRSGRLGTIEEPNLGKLIAKCLGKTTKPAPQE
jgi:hypothetical protein